MTRILRGGLSRFIRNIVLLTGLLSFAVSAMGASRTGIGFASKDPQFVLHSLGDSRFSMSMKVTKQPTIKAISSTYKQDIICIGRDRLCFTVAGQKDNTSAYLKVRLHTIEGGHKNVRTGPDIRLDTPKPQSFALGMTNDFGTSDLPFKVEKVEFLLNSGSMSSGSMIKCNIGKVSFRMPGEADSTSSSLTVVPGPRPGQMHARVVPIRIFMDFDNDDRKLEFRTRWTSFTAREKHFTPGFRERILQDSGGLFVGAASPAEADAIVYARTTSSPWASEIRKAVQKGAGLLVYGDIYDEAIRSLVPVTLKDRYFDTLPPRKLLEVKKKGENLYRSGPPKNADYGFFRTVNALKGTEVLSNLGNQPAAVLSANGKVLYSSIGVGVTQIPSRHLFDIFFLRALALVAGRPEMQEWVDLQESRLEYLEELTDRAVVFNIKGDEKKSFAAQELYKELFAIPSGPQLRQALAGIKEKLARQGEDGLLSTEGVRYHSGAHRENFGRFGWDLKEGLLSQNLNEAFWLVNGTAAYTVFPVKDTDEAIKLKRWDRKPLTAGLHVNSRGALTAKSGNFDFRWSGPGLMEYAAKVVIPKKFRDSKLFFEVKKGIDDTDTVSFNGRQIGATGTDIADYYIAPRRYKIPSGLIRFGKENQIVCKITNLRGLAGFNSLPQLTAVQKNSNQPPRKAMTVSVDRINYLSKRYRFNGDKKLAMTVTLAIPYVLYETSVTALAIQMKHLQKFAACYCNGRVKIVDLSKTSSIYERKRDGILTGGWILFWDNESGRPLVIYLSQEPESITCDSKSGMVNLKSGKPIGAFVAGFPYGAQKVNMHLWKRGLPGAVLKRIRLQQRLALNFPVGNQEIYANSLDRKKVEVVNRFQLQHINNVYGVTKESYTLLPPIMGIGIWKKILVKSPDAVDFHIATNCGPTWGKLGNGPLSATLTAPPEESYYMINVKGHNDAKREANRIFMAGSQYSCGGRVPDTAWTPQHPNGKGYSAVNFDACSWAFDFIYIMSALTGLDDISRFRFEERAGWRFFEVMERYIFKLAFRYREEPFSFTRYPVFLPPFYKSKLNFAPGFGSTIVFGDENEPGVILPMTMRMGGDTLGQYGLQISTWNSTRDMFRFPLVSTDWALGVSGCREFWGSSHLDMLNCEYPMAREYEKLAARNGDRKLADEARYQAAKRMLPTVLRFYFGDYLNAEKLDNANKPYRFITGWDEMAGANLLAFNSKFAGTIDVFDFAGGVPQDLIVLYKLYANERIRDKLSRSVLPALRDNVISVYMMIFALFGMPKTEVERLINRLSGKKFPKALELDHPGMIVPSILSGVLFSWNPEVFIAGASDIKLDFAQYDPEKRRAVFRYRPGKFCPELKIYTAFVPKSIKLNGKAFPIPQSAANGVITFKSRDKSVEISLELGAIRNHYRHPVLKDIQH